MAQRLTRLKLARTSKTQLSRMSKTSRSTMEQSIWQTLKWTGAILTLTNNRVKIWGQSFES